jgi:hypothetical protein
MVKGGGMSKESYDEALKKEQEYFKECEKNDEPITIGRFEPGIGSCEPIKWKTISKIVWLNKAMMYEVSLSYSYPCSVHDIEYIQENELTGEIRKVKVSEL